MEDLEMRHSSTIPLWAAIIMVALLLTLLLLLHKLVVQAYCLEVRQPAVEAVSISKAVIAIRIARHQIVGRRGERRRTARVQVEELEAIGILARFSIRKCFTNASRPCLHTSIARRSSDWLASLFYISIFTVVYHPVYCIGYTNLLSPPSIRILIIISITCPCMQLQARQDGQISNHVSR